MRSQLPRVVLLLCAYWCGSTRPADAQPPAQGPIVLVYRESPIFLGPHEHWVNSIAYSPDGEMLATGSDDGYVRLWDSKTGQLKSMFGDDAGRGIQSIAFSPHKHLIAVVGIRFGEDV